MEELELENKWSDTYINICSSNEPLDNISSGEEINFILHKKLTKEPAIHYKILPETHRIWD